MAKQSISRITQLGYHMNNYAMRINNDKYFLGVLLIILNLGSKFINLRLNDFHENILLNTIGRELLIFAIAFVGTRDIYVALVLSSLFILLNDYLLNQDSSICIIPPKYHVEMKKAVDTNNDNYIDENEIKQAINVLNKAQKQKREKNQRDAYMTFMNNL
jgi:hypothetical protein